MISILSWNQPYNVALPMPTGSLDGGDKQSLIWQPATPVWGGVVAGVQTYPAMLIAATL